jgi:hypothetical protein
VTTGFVTIPTASAYRLRNATVAAALLTELPAGVQVSADGLVGVDLVVRDGRSSRPRTGRCDSGPLRRRRRAPRGRTAAAGAATAVK